MKPAYHRIARATLAILGIGLGLAYAVLISFIDLHPDSYFRLTVHHTDAGTFPSGLHGWRLFAAVFRDVLPGLALAGITGLLYVRAVRRGQRPVGRGGAGGIGDVNFRREARWMMWAKPIWIVVGLLMALIASPLLRWLSSR